MIAFEDAFFGNKTLSREDIRALLATARTSFKPSSQREERAAA